MPMGKIIQPYENLSVLIPMVAIFIIIFGIVSRSMREISLFGGAAKTVIALCVTTLAVYGMDRVLIRAIVSEYTTMGMVMLFGLAGMLLIVWVGLIRKR